ncbi:MAG: hypothetical protein K2X87_16135, partial [Gemmataceae bacterium]|nr:hypothetical protein [Gemmataceae bacterium]
MGPTDDLRLLLRGLADGAVDPNLLAVVAGDWAGDGPGLIPFLVARGVLRDDDLRRLAGGTGPPAGSAGPSNTATFAGSLGETGTYRGGDETPEQTPPADPGRPPGAPDLPPGGRYRVLGFHDRGGLGEVWRAEDRLVGRVVA